MLYEFLGKMVELINIIYYKLFILLILLTNIKFIKFEISITYVFKAVFANTLIVANQIGTFRIDITFMSASETFVDIQASAVFEFVAIDTIAFIGTVNIHTLTNKRIAAKRRVARI